MYQFTTLRNTLSILAVVAVGMAIVIGGGGRRSGTGEPSTAIDRLRNHAGVAYAAGIESGSDTNRAGDASEPISRGRYLVTAMGCNDCHTPWQIGQNGPEPDMTRMLSGHPQQLVMPTPPKLPEGPWMLSGSGTMTAWAGPWGVSYAANLTPDPQTGLGQWSEDEFVGAMRSGRHRGRGRPILPPMPTMNVGALTDVDLLAVFAYLQSIPAIDNRVPEPASPLTGEAR
jgi:hypothetical protein